MHWQRSLLKDEKLKRLLLGALPLAFGAANDRMTLLKLGVSF